MGGGGPIAIGRIGGRGLSSNQPHGFMYYSNDNAVLDASPYSLSGIRTSKPAIQSIALWSQRRRAPEYSQNFQWRQQMVWFRRLERNQRRHALRYFFSRVPTVEERNGDFSGATYNDGKPVQLFDPVDRPAVSI